MTINVNSEALFLNETPNVMSAKFHLEILRQWSVVVLNVSTLIRYFHSSYQK